MFFLQIITVVTSEIAEGAGRLGEYLKLTGCLGHGRFPKSGANIAKKRGMKNACKFQTRV
jgi:hypothetical protein